MYPPTHCYFSCTLAKPVAACGLARPPRCGMLSFPPLTRKWTVRSDPNWPGAEYTRRTRLKTKCELPFSADFVNEMKGLLGDNFSHFESAMQPTIHPRLTRGRPPAESGSRPIQVAYTLPRAQHAEAGEGAMDGNPLASSTRSLSGHLSKTRVPEIMYTKFGPVPEYMFEDREKDVDSLSKWFDQYGRPTPHAINLGSRQPFTHWEKSSKRCCGEPSQVQVMKKGFITA